MVVAVSSAPFPATLALLNGFNSAAVKVFTSHHGACQVIYLESAAHCGADPPGGEFSLSRPEANWLAMVGGSVAELRAVAAGG
jgi:hypothetical protein